MASITIKETDKTTAGALNATSNIVFIPGMSVLSGVTRLTPTLCTTVAEFTAAFGSVVPTLTGDTNAPQDKSFIMARELLALGVPVLYEALSATSVTKDAIVTEISTDNFFTPLSDRGTYNVKFITTGGYPLWSLTRSEVGVVSSGATTAIKKMLDVAAGRGDCTALVDYDCADHSAIKIDKIQSAAASAFGILTGTQYAQCYAPWGFYSSSLSTATTGLIELPASFGYLAAMGIASQTNPNWLATAGVSRGTIPNIDHLSVTVTEAEANAVQPIDAVSINAICNIRPYGLVIWGNRTMYKNAEGLVASSFANIRQGVSDIKKTLYVAAKKLMFEQNSDVLWVNFKALITPLLDQMVSGDGITSYKIYKEATSTKATLKALIKIEPIEAVESFDLTVELSDSTSTVTE